MTQAPLGSNPQEPDPLDQSGPGQPDVIPPEGEGIPEEPVEPSPEPGDADFGATTHRADPYPGRTAP